MTVRFPIVLLAALGSGCIASNVVAPEQRLTVESPDELEWQPATEVRLEGLYETIDIRGEAAASLRKVYYLFSPDGTYTAAALAEIDGAFAFQTIDGTWSGEQGQLVLDGEEPVQLEHAPDHLRIRAPNGTIVMQRQELR